VNTIKTSDIAKYLDTKYYGENITVENVASLDNMKEFSLAFSKKESINAVDKKVLLLVPISFEYKLNSVYTVIKVLSPRLAFAKVVSNFFIKKPSKTIDKSTKIGSNCQIHDSVTIGMNCVIGDNVKIGKNTIINNNVVVFANTTIGIKCYIKSGSIIGEDGFGFDFEEDGTPIRIPHIGKIIIGNNVEIGAKNTIARGTIDDTVIANNVKIDDQVHIAHNCFIGNNTIITACVEISGSVTIGENCWIGPNCSIIQKVTIGDNVTIGIGSIITKDIESNKKMMGLESLELRPLLKVKKRIEYGK